MAAENVLALFSSKNATEEEEEKELEQIKKAQEKLARRVKSLEDQVKVIQRKDGE